MGTGEAIRVYPIPIPCADGASLASVQLARQEVADDGGDLGSLAFEREMPGIEQVDFGLGIVTPEGLGAGGQEERIVLAPDGEKRRSPAAEVLLEFGIERDIALVVAEQVEL